MNDTNEKRSGIECGWSKNMDADFLLRQQTLTIFLKDGYSFFKANAEVLTRRFAAPTKTTNILIVHPDSPHMAAIANMDDKKKDHPESQRSDCLQAVRLLHEIRGEKDASMAARVVFQGHDNVPTWNGFVGDEVATINLYTTRPYRGPLPSLQVRKIGGPDESLLYRWAHDECTLLMEQGREARNNLLNYRLPANLPDLRR